MPAGRIKRHRHHDVRVGLTPFSQERRLTHFRECEGIEFSGSVYQMIGTEIGDSPLAKRHLMSSDLDLLLDDSRLTELLENIEQEDTPERLLTLARELQRQLLIKKQRDKPS
jgi:hypothetical protein